MKSGPHCRAIGPGAPFLATLAGWILERYGADQAALTRVLVLLPSRRACRGLREAFLDLTQGRPLLLPRIRPIGELEEDVTLSHYAIDADIPPAIAPLRRELLLARLVRKLNQPYSIAQAASLGRQLAGFIDDAAHAGLPFDRLAGLAPEDLALHWQQTLDFLKVVSHHWPRILEEEGVIDPAEQRNRLLAATAEYWLAHPPMHPVIAAGSTGSLPATARLLAAIARLPQGMVILPGLDSGMPEAEWELVGDTHPQFGMKRLLGMMECGRGEVSPLQSDSVMQNQARIACLRAIFQPPEATAGWSQTALSLREGLAGVRLLTAETLLDEARSIAVILREALETPGKTAALVTPDRQLARMVAAQMQRFGIAIDDSAGRPLNASPPGAFLRLCIEMAATGAAPVALLALLRHPLSGAGRDTALCRRLSRELELRLLRGVRHAPGLQTLCDAAEEGELHDLLADLAAKSETLMALFSQPFKASLSELLAAHLAFAEWLASTDGEEGSERLWAGEAGNALALFLAELGVQAELLDAIEPGEYPALFDTLLAGQVYRTAYGLHPRLHILSSIEARLQHYDLTVLGALNEGTWPASPAADPWMSRPMRAAFGLPSAERAIGESAHDVFMLACAPEVMLSRARKVEGTPSVPSRWLVRLETLVRGLDADYFASMQADYEPALRQLDAPLALAPLTRPNPTPPLAARPRQLYVTAIDTWLRDPYALYAQQILRLRALPPLDEEPDAADFGTLLHEALERFTVAWPEALPPQPLETLLECGRQAFARVLDRPGIACLWWPRFEAVAGWVIEMERTRRIQGVRVLGERRGEWHFHVAGKPFTLTTRIDRLEAGADGGLVIADYKTGALPSDTDMKSGMANQLPLEGLVAQYGILSPQAVELPMVGGLEYWRLAGNAAQYEIKEVDIGMMEAAHSRLETLIAQYDDAATAYSAPALPGLKYNDYEHLTRRQEWEGV